MKRFVLAVALAASLGACSGDDGGSLDCSEFSGCGGDPVGEWTVADACLSGEISPMIDGCPDATSEIENYVVSGTVSVLANGSYSASITTTGDFILSVPMSCLGGATCEQLDESPELSCTTNGDSCDCTESLEATAQDSGTWATSGDTITLTPAGGDPESAEYCVDGEVMKLQTTSDGLTSTMVLTR